MTEQELFETAIRLVERFMPHMLPGHRYSLETMCGNTFWDSLTRYQRGIVGRFVAWAVDQRGLQLAFGDTGKRPTKMYQLR